MCKSLHICIYLENLMSLNQKKKAAILIFSSLLVVNQVSISQASVRSLWQDRASLPLIDKVGKTENLLDNPAQLAQVKNVVVDDFWELNLLDSQDRNANYRLEDQTRKLSNTFQAIGSLFEKVAFNAGGNYAQVLDIQNTYNSADDSTINSASEKSFTRSWNTGVGLTPPPTPAGVPVAMTSPGISVKNSLR